MLYFGVHFSRRHLKITALSQSFAVIDVLDWSYMQVKEVKAWANALKNNPEEPTQWFIDEKDFFNPDFPAQSFRFSEQENTVFLVNHRALCELMQFIRQFSWLMQDTSQSPLSDFFLASAIRVFHKNDYKLLTPEIPDF
jgi:hypothetical protein